MIRLSGQIKRFRPQSSSRRQLPFPAAPHLRIAQVTASSARFDLVETFPPDQWEQLENYRPHLLIGASGELRRLAEQTRVGILDLSSVDHAVFVLSSWGDRPASDILRVVLWQAFGVPVYELFIGANGIVLASECEAHQGWHVEGNARFSMINDELVLDAAHESTVRSSFRGILETALCPCGRSGARLIDVEHVRARDVPRELAATA